MDETRTRFDKSPPDESSFEELASRLSSRERHVLLDHGTEAPLCGLFLDEKRDGVYGCRLCGLPLFQGRSKFESGTGWPSFTTHLQRTASDMFVTTATAWFEPGSSAPAAALTRGMYLPMARHRPAIAIASIPSASSSFPGAGRCPTSLAAARPKASSGSAESRRASARPMLRLGE